MKKLCFFAMALMAFAASAQVTLDKAVDYAKEHFTISGYAQAGWDYDSEGDPKHDFKLRRIILMADYRINDHWNAFIMTDFKALSLHEYWVNYRVAPWMNWKLGQFKTPFSLENPISPSVMEMITQMSAPGTWMIAGGSPFMMPGGAGRDLGLTVYGDIDKWVSYDLAVMNGAGRNKSDDNSWKDFVGRLTFHPLKQLKVSGSLILGKGALKSVEGGIPGCEATTGDFKRNRYAVGAQLLTKPVSVRSEMMWGRDSDLKSRGAYITAQVSNIGVKNLDLVASYDYLKVDDVQEQSNYQVGLQYWFYKKCRIQVGYRFRDNYEWGNDSRSVLTQLQVGF